MYRLKITRVGNSAGVVLPKPVLDKLHLSNGDTVCLTETPDGFKLTPLDQEFTKQTEAAKAVMREDRDVLRALAKR
ncbi:MAG: AbrB/MazE/SpoVT family DNA-binding domain-containing protein [Parvibaculaceae bacterium]